MEDWKAFETSVIDQVAGHAPISFDELHRLIGEDSWSRLFAVTDRLSREGALAIRRVGRGTYLISLGPGLSNMPREVSRSPPS